MAASGKSGWDELFPPTLSGFNKVPFGDISAMRSAVSEKTIAIMLEPIQGEAGVVVPPAGYLQALRALADEKNLLLILDEVQTGVGRCGESFAFIQAGIKPDIVTLGKGLGGGVPISAMMAAKHACVFEHGDQGGTYNGNPLMAAVALTVVETVCTDAFLRRVKQAGQLLHQSLSALQSKFGLLDIRGCGLLWAVDLPESLAAAVQGQAMQQGLLINAPRPNTLRLMPALDVSDTEIELASGLLESALGSVLESVQSGKHLK